jgi:hypothetical protein
MPGVETADLAATCTHAQTGSSEVFANGKGISRINKDTAMGTILGPGSQTVFVEGIKVSLPGDVILPHAPCGSPGGTPHCAATTNPGGSPDVIVGTGFISGGGGGSHGDIPAGDLKITSFTALPSNLIADSPPLPATPLISKLTPVIFSYTLQNTGDGAVGSFTLGLWKTPFTGTFLLTQDGAEKIGATKIDTVVIPSLGAGEVYSNTFEHIADPDWIKDSTTWFAVFPDIYNEIGEIDERNWVASLAIKVS